MTARKIVTVCYYAALREAAGRSQEALESAAVTAADLYDEVAAMHAFPFDRSVLRAVVNDTIVPWTSEVKAGDTVVFLAPFAGG